MTEGQDYPKHAGGCERVLYQKREEDHSSACRTDMLFSGLASPPLPSASLESSPDSLQAGGLYRCLPTTSGLTAAPGPAI